jgi:hypothetical protein
MADRETIIDAGGGDGGATGIVIAAIIVALLVAGGFLVFNSTGDRNSVTLDIPKVTVTTPAAPANNG